MKTSASELGLKAALGINRSFENHTSIHDFLAIQYLVVSELRRMYRPATVCSAGSVQYNSVMPQTSQTMPGALGLSNAMYLKTQCIQLSK